MMAYFGLLRPEFQLSFMNGHNRMHLVSPSLYQRGLRSISISIEFKLPFVYTENMFSLDKL
uniref:Uncharacterized protein n=1 Tax=Anguilla anguilla TaxID=7936 RepID=A0A0E9V9H2_ANGAN